MELSENQPMLPNRLNHPARSTMTSKNASHALMQQAVALHSKGAIPAAEAIYRRVLAADPRHADALRLLGGLYIQWHKPGNAIPCFEKALAVTPANPELHNNLGVALAGQGRFADALHHYRQAVKIAPAHGSAVDNLGNLLYTTGALTEAAEWLASAARLQPDNPRPHTLLGHIARLQNRAGDAIAHYRAAIARLPDDTEALTHLGNLLRAAGQSAEACAIYNRLAALYPDDPAIHLNLGALCHDRGDFPAAMAHYDRGLSLQPDNTDLLVNRAGQLIALDRPAEAVAAYDRALRVAPALPAASWGKSLAHLMLGEYEAGWRLYEDRFAHAPLPPPLPAVPRWDGAPLTGQRLLIWSEQGFGDVIQFIRYAALCKEQGAAVTVLCGKPLLRLLQNCPFIDRAVTAVENETFDWHIPVMSLPLRFGTTLATIPCRTPYLYVSEAARARWAPRFAPSAAARIGLVWAGNPRLGHIDAHVADRQRSLPLEQLRPLLAFAAARYYSLQKGPAATAEIAAAGLQDQLIDYMPDAADFMDTAAIIANLDLVITVDTAVAHLAGALAKPVWILSRYAGCWRWLRNRPDSPWYPTARIFSPPGPGDWQPCIASLRQALAERLRGG